MEGTRAGPDAGSERARAVAVVREGYTGVGKSARRRWDVATVADGGEAWVIEAVRRRMGPPPAGATGIGDDAAVLPVPPGGRILASQDMLVEGVHFRRDWMPPERIGAKAVAVNVSDMAAMGGRPFALLMALALPGTLERGWVERLLDGVAEAAAGAAAPVVGGDTVGSPAGVVLDMAILGTAQRPILRAGAQPGDWLVVTGPLGGSAAGLACFKAGAVWPGATTLETAALRQHACPPGRLDAGRVLAGHAHAMTDISDGFWTEVEALVQPMGLGAVVNQEHLPVWPEAAAVARRVGAPADAPLHWALTGGEDYELLAAVPAEGWLTLQRELGAVDVEAVVVGRVERTPGVRLLRGGQRVSWDTASQGGFDHFGRG